MSDSLPPSPVSGRVFLLPDRKTIINTSVSENTSFDGKIKNFYGKFVHFGENKKSTRFVLTKDEI